ncbi:S8 family serine peptidase [Duganella sp. Root1480D1]|uniref:S8 family serine peptidase n=1 Tax=Duganella sp. Root1480D1 TaxID=1736471 RepID=UPI00070F258E|nr:S8 family serine peptidase [Duganella sp. Root1480D1]KQZ45129.1 serine protease [Duganella sp. Root1480D1]
MNTLKVFASKDDVMAIAGNVQVIESYGAFIVVEAGSAAEKKLIARLPVENITEQFKLPLGGKQVDPLAPKRAAKALNGSKPQAVDSKQHHYIVQFIGPIKSSWLSAVKREGAVLRNPIGNFGYVVRGNKQEMDRIGKLRYVRWTGHLPHADRIAPALKEKQSAAIVLPRRQAIPDVVAVDVFSADDIGRIKSAAAKLDFKLLSSSKEAKSLTLASSAIASQRRAQVGALSAVHGVRFIRERVLPRTCNNVAVQIMGNKFSALLPSGLGLTGSGETVAVCDTGLDTGNLATMHPDFGGRIAAIKSYPITPEWDSYVTNPAADDGPADTDSGHGTHVAGSVLGDGSASTNGPIHIRGHAHKAKLVFQAIEQEMKWRPTAPASLRRRRFALAGIPANLMDLFKFAYDKGARIHSNSWGGGDPGEYDKQCEQFDQFVWKYKDMCFVIAAGNDGSDEDGDGQINLGSVTSPGTAKNCITVGACENQRPEFNSELYGNWWGDDYPVQPFKSAPMADNPQQVVAFSSRGPTADGRIKPDVVAPGTFILSTRSTMIGSNNFGWSAYPNNNLYFHMGGTSMATPLTSGALALMREYLRTKHKIASPSAALLKALLIAGVERLPKVASSATLLDNHQGFGRVNLDRSLAGIQVLVEGAGLKTGQKASQTVKVASTGKTLRIVLAYTDYPGTALVNNLNLIVTDPAGKRYVGNQGSAANSLLLDNTNNVELLHVPKARKGTWTVDVVASNIVHGPQDFALAAVLVA